MLPEAGSALKEASAELQKGGFVRQTEGFWIGKLPTAEKGEITARIQLPPNFPYDLPAIYINRSDLPHRIPHVEKNGKICIAPTSGILIDTSRPGDIIRESLQRAKQVILSGIHGNNEADLIDEFLAYWDGDLEEGLCSICDPEGPSRRVFSCRIESWRGIKKANIVIADSKAVADSWAEAMGKKTEALPGSFFVKLQRPFLPPDFDETYSVKRILGIIRENTCAESFEALNQWFQERKPPVTIVLSVPLSKNLGRALISIRIPCLSGPEAKLAQKGWGAGRVTVAHEIMFGPEVPVTRLFVARLDKDLLVARCGAEPSLSGKIVSVIGCGSVGSYVVEQLAAMGVGRLRLIDHESLKAENIHRHALGLAAVNYNKAQALKVSLGLKYPHIQVEVRDKKVQDVLGTEGHFITGSDLIVVAVGDETLEIWINSQLGTAKPRVHVWTEPLGIGQHLLATGLGADAGCYECLFEPSAEFGLTNKAAFAEPGQAFQQSIAGCGGSFISFSANDVVRAAVEAASLIQEILMGSHGKNVLVSRFGDPTVFGAKGYRLSKRANIFQPGQVIKEYRFPREDCSSCAR